MFKKRINDDVKKDKRTDLLFGIPIIVSLKNLHSIKNE